MSQQSRNDPKSPTPPAKPAAEQPGTDQKSGRVRVDERGQAVWEWAVQTGMFDRNASTSRIRALTEGAMNLELEDGPAPKPSPAAAKPTTGNPYERAAVARPSGKETAGSDPYSRGPARKPESMTFNPHERNPKRKP